MKYMKIADLVLCSFLGFSSLAFGSQSPEIKKINVYTPNTQSVHQYLAGSIISCEENGKSKLFFEVNNNKFPLSETHAENFNTEINKIPFDGNTGQRTFHCELELNDQSGARLLSQIIITSEQKNMIEIFLSQENASGKDTIQKPQEEIEPKLKRTSAELKARVEAARKTKEKKEQEEKDKEKRLEEVAAKCLEEIKATELKKEEEQEKAEDKKQREQEIEKVRLEKVKAQEKAKIEARLAQEGATEHTNIEPKDTYKNCTIVTAEQDFNNITTVDSIKGSLRFIEDAVLLTRDGEKVPERLPMSVIEKENCLYLSKLEGFDLRIKIFDDKCDNKHVATFDITEVLDLRITPWYKRTSTFIGLGMVTAFIGIIIYAHKYNVLPSDVAKVFGDLFKLPR